MTKERDWLHVATPGFNPDERPKVKLELTQWSAAERGRTHICFCWVDATEDWVEEVLDWMNSSCYGGYTWERAQ
jgi:hypothetical protein